MDAQQRLEKRRKKWLAELYEAGKVGSEDRWNHACSYAVARANACLTEDEARAEYLRGFRERRA